MSADVIEYSPTTPFAAPTTDKQLPRVFGGPSRYVQGQGVIDQAGHYLSRLGMHRCAVLMSKRCQDSEGQHLVKSMNNEGVQTTILTFGGECSFEEIDQHTNAISNTGGSIDGIVAVGGGKVVDAGRAIARRLDLPVAVIPTLASNDAPCAAVSIIYTPEGVTADAEIYDVSPVLVLVDTGVIAAAEPRYLAAGMGDALATWYEARACAENPDGINVFGGRPTLAGTGLARLCADTIYARGTDAFEANRRQEANEALEQIVEANTLLSGLGYESGGLAICHAIAQGYTVLDKVHSNYLHGEMVAMGVLTQLMLEGDAEEAAKAARLFDSVGLPTRLEDIGLAESSTDELEAVIQGAMAFPYLTNMPGNVNEDKLMTAILDAHNLGKGI